MATVVILLSDKRSGSTMFEREICKHQKVQKVDYTPHTYNETHYWLKSACVLKTPEKLFDGDSRYKGYGSVSDARKSLIDGIKGNVPDFIVPEDDEALVFEGWDALCEKYATPVFFEKSPQHPHHWAALDLMLKWADMTDHRVLFLGLVRNPMAVLYSAQQLFNTDPEVRQFSWANSTRNILFFKNLVRDDQFKLVRYEDLIEKPAEEFKAICQFIGIDFNQSMGANAHKNSKNKWLDDQMFSLQLHESVGRLAKYLGYEDTDLNNSDKPVFSIKKQAEHKFTMMLKRVRSRSIPKIKRLLSRFIN